LIIGVILAAGQAKRMGQPKLLLPLGGRPLVWRVAAAACRAELDQVLVVTGAYAAEVREAVTGLPLRLVHNQEWESGQSYSVVSAVLAAPAEASALLFLLADQPLVDEELINSLVRTYRRTGAAIVAPYWQDRRGNPVLFDLGTWREALLRLTGDAGAKSILEQNTPSIGRVQLSSGDSFLDVDTPAEYEAVVRLWRQRKTAPD